MTNSVQYDLEHPLLISKFSNIGLVRDDVKGLPEDVRESLSNGSLSPLILLQMKSGENTYYMPAKIRIGIDKETNHPELYVYGTSKEVVNNDLVDSVGLKKLTEGSLLRIQKPGAELYLQFDPETKNILSFKAEELDLDKRLNNVEKILDIELGKEQKERIKEGKPITLDVGGENVTLGVDLRSPNFFKQLQGDMNEWKRQKEIDYDIAHPEYIGLVQTDQNRWEYQQIKNTGYNSQKLKETPAQTKTSGMKL